ncbi:baeRF2 domain-containing protein [Streptomyces niger]|uniref:baeRF2 domain-containing protein n=1 Tax=Streptomyces niger TaxID=66373 RepID=UPI00069BDF9D|nr:Vms1/Ankzf1 family peptidyl-tRNA hydrolase [Streptomyces niger]
MRLSLLQPIVERPGPWASVYADVSHDTEDAAKQQELSARDAADRLSALGADDATCRAVHDCLTSLRRPGQSLAHSGRAIFATGGEVVLDTPLAGPPVTRDVTWSPVPRLAPLLDALGENPVCLVVYVDRTGADFELRSDTARSDAGQVSGDDYPVHRTATGDWSERHFQLKVENTWEQNAGEIADAVAQAFEHSGAELILLAGDARERRSVHDRLPEQLRAVAYESEHGGRARGADSTRLERDIAQVRAGLELDHTSDIIQRFQAGSGRSNGESDVAAGVPNLIEAAREHRIDTLLISPDGGDAGREVWVGPGPDQLAVRGSEMQYLGEVHPAPARADDALLRAAVAGGAQAVMLHHTDEEPPGGLGALLRWSTPVTH